MKAISSAAAAVIIATISVALVGTTYFFSKSLTENAIAETFEIVDIFQNRIIVRNTGTQPISKFKILIDGNEVENNIKDSPIQPQSVGTVNVSLEGIGPGRHQLTLISRSMSQTWMWEFKQVETTTLITSSTTTIPSTTTSTTTSSTSSSTTSPAITSTTTTTTVPTTTVTPSCTSSDQCCEGIDSGCWGCHMGACDPCVRSWGACPRGCVDCSVISPQVAGVGIITGIEANVETEQDQAEIGKPVKWTSSININNPYSVDIKDYALHFVLPEEASKIEIKNEEEQIISKGQLSMSVNVAPKETKNYILEYETPAPYKKEDIIKPFVFGETYSKRIIVKSEFSGHYKNVKAYTDIPEELIKNHYELRLFHIENDTRIDVTDRLEYNVTFLDIDNNGFYDRIQWIIPELSEQEYTIEGYPISALYSESNAQAGTSNDLTLTNSANANGAPNNLYASCSGGWYNENWYFIMNNTNYNGRVLYVNVTLGNIYADAIGNSDTYAFMCNANDDPPNSGTWNTLWSGTSLWTSPQNRTYNLTQICGVDTWEKINKTRIKITSTAKSGGEDTRTWYVDFVQLRIVYKSEVTYDYLSVNNSAPKPNEYVEHKVHWITTTPTTFSTCTFWSNYTGPGSNESCSIVNGWTNITKQMPSTPGYYAWRIFVNNSANVWNDTGIQTMSVSNRWLEVNLTNPDPKVYNESQPKNIIINESFNVNATVKCRTDLPNLSCGSVSAGVRYNDSNNAMTLVNITSNAQPMFVVGGTETEVSNPPFYYDDGWSFTPGSEIGTQTLWDIVFNGTYFWIILRNGTLVRYNSSGGYDNWSVNLANSGITDTNWECLDFNGTNFFACGVTNTEVYAFDSTGTYTGFHFDIGTTASNPFGLVFNGTYYWVLQSISGNDNIYRFDSAGNPIDSWPADATGGEPINGGMDYDGTYFYISSVVGGQQGVYRYNTTGDHSDQWNFSTAPIQTMVYGVQRSNWDNGKYFWCLDYMDKQVRRYTHNVTPGAANPISLGNLNSGDLVQVNFTINTTSLGTYKIDVNFTSSYPQVQENKTEYAVVRIGISEDITPPQWSGNNTSPESPTYYLPDKFYQFNITWQDPDSSVSVVLIEQNFTTLNSTLENRTMLNESSKYYFNVTDLPVGTYVWRSYANNTFDYGNSTPQWIYVVNKTPTLTRLYLNGSESDKSFNKSEIVNITATTNVSSLFVVIYANYSGELKFVNSSQGVTHNFTNTSNLALGPYLIKANTSVDSNYTSSQANYTLTVVDEIPPQYSDNSTNNTVAGYMTNFKLKWRDNNALDSYIFYFDNCTGEFKKMNETKFSKYGQTEDWSKESYVINSTVGCTIKWRFEANDTLNNRINSSIYSFTVAFVKLPVILIEPSPIVCNDTFPCLKEQNKTYVVTAKATCMLVPAGKDCGQIYGLLRYNNTSSVPDTPIPTTPGEPMYAKPLYVVVFFNDTLLSSSNNKAFKSDSVYYSPDAATNPFTDTEYSYANKSADGKYVNTSATSTQTCQGANTYCDPFYDEGSCLNNPYSTTCQCNWRFGVCIGRPCSSLSPPSCTNCGCTIEYSTSYAQTRFTFNLSDYGSKIVNITYYYKGYYSKSGSGNFDAYLQFKNSTGWCTDQNIATTDKIYNKTLWLGSTNTTEYMLDGTFSFAVTGKVSSGLATIKTHTDFVKLVVYYSKDNPQPCSAGSLKQGETCTVDWLVNATGNLDTRWKIDVNFTSDPYQYPPNNAYNDTDNAVIRILELFETNVTSVKFNVSSFQYNNPIKCNGTIMSKKVNAVYYKIYHVGNESKPEYAGSLDLVNDCIGSSWATGKTCNAVVPNVQGVKGNWNCSIIAYNGTANTTGYASTPAVMVNTPPTKPSITLPINNTMYNKKTREINISCINTTLMDVNSEDNVTYIISYSPYATGASWTDICSGDLDGNCTFDLQKIYPNYNRSYIRCNMSDGTTTGPNSDLIYIRIDWDDPVCNLTIPNSQVLQSPYILNGTYSDSISGIANVTYYNLTNNANDKIGTNTTSPFTYQWFVPNSLENNVNVTIMAVCYDNAGNSANDTEYGIKVDLYNTPPQIWNLKVRELTDYPIDKVWPMNMYLITVNASDEDPVRNISYVECNFTDVKNGEIKIFNLTDAKSGHDYTHNESLFIKYYWGPGQGWVNVTVYDKDGQYNKTTTNITIVDSIYLVLDNNPINFSVSIPGTEKNATDKRGWPLIIQNYGNVPVNISQNASLYLTGLNDPNVKILITNITWNQTDKGSFSELTNYDKIINGTLQSSNNQSVYYKMRIPALKSQDYGGIVIYHGSKS